jgi:tetratricopeptide (TPR) repeat protein
VAAVVARAMAKARDARFATMAELIAALEGTPSAPSATPSKGQALPGSAKPLVRSARWPVIALALALVASFAFVIVALTWGAAPPPPVRAPVGALAPSLPSDKARIALERAQRNFDLKRYDEARKEFEEAYVESGEAPLLYNVAQMYRLAGRKRDASDLYRRFLEVAPTTPMRTRIEDWIREGER